MSSITGVSQEPKVTPLITQWTHEEILTWSITGILTVILEYNEHKLVTKYSSKIYDYSRAGGKQFHITSTPGNFDVLEIDKFFNYIQNTRLLYIHTCMIQCRGTKQKESVL